jgi:signal transduction histidine kinase
LLHAWRGGEQAWWLDALLAVLLSVVALSIVTSGDASSSGDEILRLPRQGDVPAPAPPGEERFEPPEDPDSTALGLILTVLITAPLAVRRRWPLACLAIQFTSLLVYDHELTLPTLLALLIGSYSLAVYGASVPLSMAALLVAGTATAAVKNDTWPELPDWSGVFAILLPIGLFGVAIRAARSRARASEQRAEALQREQQAATRLAVTHERARIARELHDVVTHHVSVMTIQAGAAGKVLDADPELARGALSAIESSGRETMAELRHLLGVLGPTQAEELPAEELLHPQPGLAQLDTLIDNVRRAGQPVSATRTPVELPNSVDLTAYRVVQEALTNALRHAPGARTEVVITIEPSSDRPSVPDLVIEVTNEPPVNGSPAGTGSGTGLVGLAERLRLYGGTLESGRRLGGGFRVLARLPLAVPEASPPLDAP